jgi:hypothetical protein
MWVAIHFCSFYMFCTQPSTWLLITIRGLGPIVDGRQLPIGVIVGQFSFNDWDMRIIALGWVVISGFPQTKVV